MVCEDCIMEVNDDDYDNYDPNSNWLKFAVQKTKYQIEFLRKTFCDDDNIDYQSIPVKKWLYGVWFVFYQNWILKCMICFFLFFLRYLFVFRIGGNYLVYGESLSTKKELDGCILEFL